MVPFRKYSPDTFERTHLNKKANPRKRCNKYIENNNISIEYLLFRYMNNSLSIELVIDIDNKL